VLEGASEGGAVDRRGSERQLTIFRAGKITHLGRENLCLVRNISSGGAMAQVFQTLKFGDPVMLDLRLDENIVGHVVWAHDALVGIEFTRKVDLAEVLRSEKTDGQRRRAPRVNVEATGQLQIGDVLHPVAIDNVSQTGTRIFCAQPLVAGAEVRLLIDGLGSFLSFVCWTNNGIVGLAFCRALSILELTTWVREQTMLANERNIPDFG
jgi:hypothetical protein